MKEIKCPKCGEVFTIDEAAYNDIVNQIKTTSFNDEVKERVEEVVRSLKIENAAKVKEVESTLKEELNKTILELSSKNASLEAELKQSNVLKEHAIKDALTERDIEIVKLKDELAAKDTQYRLEKEQNINKQEQIIKEKDEQIAYYRDLKTRLSTKMVGESLEEHCSTLFTSIRNAAYPNCYFEKDSDIKNEGKTKGDFIFKDFIDGVEYISIMFEMKNENDTTETKHKNEEFFAKLDSDRRKKGCEYAVLVSTLEADSDLYNAGIVDVSHRYEKMFVVRPQCFLTIINLLTSAAKNTVDYKRQLIEIRNENIDISNFEDKLITFKDAFEKNCGLANEHFSKVIRYIDETIARLNNVKDELLGTSKQLGYANNKLQDISVKSLTRGNETMKRKFEELNNK